MSDHRRMFTEFVEQPISEVPGQVVRDFLWEASTGLVSFHNVVEAVDNWRGWYKHLLPGLIIRADETYAFHILLESIITAFFRVHSKGIQAEYKGFREDVLNTLGQAVMMPSLWDEAGESICAQYQSWEAYGSLWPACSGAISASLFFCLAYLETDEILPWTKSIVAINSGYFQAHFIAWLAGAHEILTEDVAPFPAIERQDFDIKWLDSWSLAKMSPAIPTANISEFRMSVRQVLTIKTLCGWLDNISRYDDLSEPLAAAKVAEFVADNVLARLE